MPRLGAGLVIVLVAMCCAGQHSAIADPIDDAFAIWSAVTGTVAGKKPRQRNASKRSAKTPQENALDTEPIPPLPVRKDRASIPAKADAKSAPAKEAEAVPDVWQPDEIAAAKSRCAALLENLDAVVIPQPQLKERACGTPAPVRLVSLGKQKQVAFSPPALVNCEMVAALNTWITNHLQLLARKHLGTSVIKVEVMSDYSCRNSFGRLSNRLSEHAFANALDIRGFVTEKGQTAYLLNNWGLTQRDIAAQVAAAKAEREIAAQIAADQTAKKKSPTIDNAAKPGDAKYKLAAVRLTGPEDHVLARKAERAAKVAALSMQVQSDPTPTKKGKFLRAAHAAACRIFGTTLGPEVNEAHRNHFHVDMAIRKYKKICD
ncbi:MAG: extensin family protein [Hyphomicrobium sp.]